MEPNTKILVLDDEPLIRLMVCSRLEQAGALVSEAGTCAEALGLALNANFDAAVFDYRLPDGDGLGLIRRLRGSGAGFPVVMLSGESGDIAAEAANEPGVCAVFSKPPDVAGIVEAVETALLGRVPVREPQRMGRYVCWKVEPSVMEIPAGFWTNDWVALDVSDANRSESFPSIAECFRSVRCGVAVVGAGIPLREHLGSLGIQIDFVSDMDELAALSRRPSSPAERAALMDVSVART